MKKLFTCLLVLSTVNAFAYSEGKALTKLTADGKISEASIKVAVQGVLLGATISNPFVGLWIYLCVTSSGPGLNADLDFLTYDQKYGLLANLAKTLHFTTEHTGSITDGTKSTYESTANVMQATAKKILSESDAFYADGIASPEKTPELYRNAKELSDQTGLEINEAADKIIKAIDLIEG